MALLIIFPYLVPMTEQKIPKRRHIRELVLQSLYALEISKDAPQHIIDTILSEIQDSEIDFDFAQSLFIKTIAHQAEMDKRLKSKTEHWEFHRIALIDKILLRMSLCELLYFPDIPPKVTINEAIEIAKDYSTESSGTFINGIMDAVLIDLKKEGLLNKTGRGLLETQTKKSRA
ncbi:MAG: transcription antitermination factor NusB [Bacteroidota bacterium]